MSIKGNNILLFFLVFVKIICVEAQPKILNDQLASDLQYVHATLDKNSEIFRKAAHKNRLAHVKESGSVSLNYLISCQEYFNAPIFGKLDSITLKYVGVDTTCYAYPDQTIKKIINFTKSGLANHNFAVSVLLHEYIFHSCEFRIHDLENSIEGNKQKIVKFEKEMIEEAMSLGIDTSTLMQNIEISMDSVLCEIELTAWKLQLDLHDMNIIKLNSKYLTIVNTSIEFYKGQL